MMDYGLVRLKSLGKYIISNGRSGLENSVSNKNRSYVLAAEGGDWDGVAGPHILLEVNEPGREDEHLAVLKDSADELVVGVRCHEADEKVAF